MTVFIMIIGMLRH